jgi:hypothetical protein
MEKQGRKERKKEKNTTIVFPVRLSSENNTIRPSGDSPGSRKVHSENVRLTRQFYDSGSPAPPVVE